MRIRFGVTHDYAPVAGVTLRRIYLKESNTEYCTCAFALAEVE